MTRRELLEQAIEMLDNVCEFLEANGLADYASDIYLASQVLNDGDYEYDC